MNLKKTHLILHTIARYFLASVILMYAVGKIVGTQFSSSPSVWDKSVGELSGFELTWFYFGYSFWYGVFIAASQIIAAFLLFFRRTTRLGIVLYLSIMVNVWAIDFAYGIDAAKGMATILVLVGTYVLLSEFKAFENFFLKSPPLFADAERPRWMNKLNKLKYAYIPILIGGLFAVTITLKDRIMTKNEFYGAWKPVNYQNWERVYFQEASTFSIRSNDNLQKLYSGKYTVNRETGVMELAKFTVPEEEIDVLDPDSSQLSQFMVSNYELFENKLILRSDTLTLELVRLK